MTVDDVARIFPYLADADRQAAADLYTAADPLQTALEAAVKNPDHLRMFQQQISQAVYTAVTMIGQKS